MKVTASEVLRAIRKKYDQNAVIREVSIRDTAEDANYRRFKLDMYSDDAYMHSYYQKYFKGLHVPDTLPDGWSPATRKFERRIDALMIDSKASRTAIEIKVTRSDFKADTAEKRGPWEAVTHKFVYAVPKGLVSPEEVPSHCGLWEYDPSESGFGRWQHGITVAKRAKLNKSAADLPDYLVRSLLGRLSRYEWENEKVLTAP